MKFHQQVKGEVSFVDFVPGRKWGNLFLKTDKYDDKPLCLKAFGPVLNSISMIPIETFIEAKVACSSREYQGKFYADMVIESFSTVLGPRGGQHQAPTPQAQQQQPQGYAHQQPHQQPTQAQQPQPGSLMGNDCPF